MVSTRQSPAKGGAADEGPSSSSRRAASPPPPTEERCQRNDGKGWRCRGRKVPGRSFCEVHHRQYVQKAGKGTEALDGSRSAAKEDAVDSSSNPPGASRPPPVGERCEKNDGKGWRCGRGKLPGKSFCEVHYRKYVRKSKKRQTMVSDGGGEVKGEGGGSNGRAAARVRASEGKEEASRPGAEDVHKKREKKSKELEKLRNAADNGATAGTLLGKGERHDMPLVDENSDEETLKLGKMESSPELEDKKVKKRGRKRKEEVVMGKRPKVENPAVEEEVIPDSSPVTQLVNTVEDCKKKLLKLKGPDAVMCHQCQRNDKGWVVGCLKCKKKRYCVPCIKRCCERIDLVNVLSVDRASSPSVTSVAAVTTGDAIPSIKDCVDALKLLPHLSRDTYIKALDLFKDANNRSLFIVLNEEDKADWVYHHTS